MVRGFLGGLLMGLANLVPGVSGGTMLVAAGIYDRFIQAVSALFRLQWSRGTLLLLFVIGLGGLVALGGGAKLVSIALAEARWQTYSVFIGLTVGGIPAMIALCKPTTRNTWIGMVIGIACMLALVVIQGRETTGALGAAAWPMLVVGGAAGASAMILPGVSGAYLLLLLGQYRLIIDSIRDAVAAASQGDISGVFTQLGTLIPVGIGVIVGIALVSNLLRVALQRARDLTLGVLLGLLIAAPAGLWPFKEAVPPKIGETYRGELVTADTLQEVTDVSNAKHWKEAVFTPNGGHIAACLGLVALGGMVTIGVSVVGKRLEAKAAPSEEPGKATDGETHAA